MDIGLELLAVAAAGWGAGWLLQRHLQHTLEILSIPEGPDLPPVPKKTQRPVFLAWGLSAGTVGLFLLRGATPLFLQEWILGVSLLGIAWVDLKTLYIDTPLLLLSALLQGALLWFVEPEVLPERILALLVGAGGLYWIGVIYETLRHREGLGSGDAAVLGLLGLWTGAAALPVITLGAAVLGLLWGGVLMLRSGSQALQTAFPFAPCLCLSGAATYAAQALCHCSLLELWMH
jgi:leader peptidase (prepilin peptidase)/N-methyltransferase